MSYQTNRYSEKIDGKWWTVKFTTELPYTKGDQDHGSCCRKQRLIKVNSRLKGWRAFRALLHEHDHAANDYKDEGYVDEWTWDFAEWLYRQPEVLERCGLRLIEE